MYRKRCIDNLLKTLLASKGVVNIVGVKYCGKTTTAKYHSNSQILLKDTLLRESNQSPIENIFEFFSDKESPLLLDEWYEYPLLWNAVGQEVGKRHQSGQLILTSSSSLLSKYKVQIEDLGIGEIATIEMLPMSLYESGESSGAVSLKDLFEDNQEFSMVENNLSVSKLAYVICRGGWPEAVSLEDTASLKISQDYYKSFIDNEISNYDGVKRSSKLCNLIMESLARNISTSVTKSSVISDVKNNYSVTKETVELYINVLNNLFIFKTVKQCRYNLRSSSSLRTTPTKYFADSSIATSALNITPNNLLEDFHMYNSFFRNLCIRDLNIYCNCIEGKMFKYQDRYGLEIDSIIELQDGRWGAFVFSLEDRKFEKLASNLLKFNYLMIEKENKPASFLGILTSTKYGYKRYDGVIIIPIGCLKD